MLKEAKGKKILTFKGTPIRLSAYFLAEILQDRSKWDDTFKLLGKKKKKTHPAS